MESLSTNVSSLDDLDINCDTHHIPAMGICGDNNCKEKKLICMKCIKNGPICVGSEGHELICLSEFLYRFFSKDNSKSIDTLEINSMIEAIKFSNKEEKIDYSKLLKEYIDSNHLMIEFNCLKILEELEIKLNDTKEQIQNLYKNKYNIFIEDESKNKHLNKFLNLNIPEFLKKLNANQIREALVSKSISKELKDSCIQTIKFSSDKGELLKCVEYGDKLKALSQINSVTDLKSFQDKLDYKLKTIEVNFNKQIDELEKVFILDKNELSYTRPTCTFKSNPQTLEFKLDICSTAHKSNSIDGVFCAFRSVLGESFVVWGTPNFVLEVYDLKVGSIVKSITQAHTGTIFSCRHYMDKIKNKDVIITSSYDKSLKVWSVESWSKILNINSAHSGYYLYSACFLSDPISKKNYVISSAPNEYTKVWDGSDGKFLRDVGVNNESTYFLDTWFDPKAKKYYILNANSSDVKAYDFSTSLLYKKYAGTPQTWHMSAYVQEINKVFHLIESDGNGNIRLWDFHSAVLIKTISTSGVNLRGICIWNDQYVFSSGSDYHVKLYDIKNAQTYSFKGHTSTVCALQKIIHPQYGECLISHGLDGKLKLWTNKKK